MIRAMNARVATNAFAARRETQSSVGYIGRLRIDMALQAKEPAFPSKQKHSANTSVRSMTTSASLNFHRSMLEHKGTTFFGVTTDTTFPVRLL